MPWRHAEGIMVCTFLEGAINLWGQARGKEIGDQGTGEMRYCACLFPTLCITGIR